VAISEFVKLVPITVLWPLPLVSAMLAGRPGVLVRLKVADALPAIAVTVYAPTLLFAVNVPALAMPELLVATWMVFVELENVPLCPLLPLVAVKVTLKLGMATLPASFTVTERAVLNAELMAVD
jgi:hypothetical protein